MRSRAERGAAASLLVVGDPGGDRAVLDLADGARMTELVLGGRSLLVPFDGQEPMWWGAFVMAPWTSLLRDPADVGGIPFAPPPGDAAWHGLARDIAWSRADDGGLEAPLPAPWPYGGRIRMEVAVRPGELGLRLSALAGEVAMPVALGWHPWFRRVVDGAGAVLHVPDDALVQARDAAGVPTGEWAAPAGGWNDGVRTGPVEVAYPGRGVLRVSWDAPFAILFDEHPQGVCVEPTTSPAESMAHVVGPGERLDLTIAVRWSAAPDAS